MVGLKLRRREAVCLPSQLKFLKLSRHHVKPKQTSCVISSLCKSATCQRHLSQLTEEVQLWNSHQNIKTSGLLDPPLPSLPPTPHPPIRYMADLTSRTPSINCSKPSCLVGITNRAYNKIKFLIIIVSN